MASEHAGCEILAEYWADTIRRMAVCTRQLRRHLAAVADTEGLSDSEFLLLCACQVAPAHSCSQQDLAERIALSPAQVSGLIESMRARGCLVTHRAHRDRRRQHWILTQAGAEILRRLFARLEVMSQRWDIVAGPSRQHLALCLDRLAEVDWPATPVARNEQREAA